MGMWNHADVNEKWDAHRNWGQTAAPLDALEQILAGLLEDMRQPGIAGQSQIHARLEDLEVALRRIGAAQNRTGAARNAISEAQKRISGAHRDQAHQVTADDRQRSLALLEECRRRLAQSHDVLVQLSAWVEARRASGGLEESYCGKVGRGRVGSYGSEHARHGALEARG